LKVVQAQEDDLRSSVNSVALEHAAIKAAVRIILFSSHHNTSFYTLFNHMRFLALNFVEEAAIEAAVHVIVIIFHQNSSFHTLFHHMRAL
jgi:hypothetical protein